MDEQNQDAPEVLETPETEAEAVETTEQADEAQEDIEALRAKAAKAEELEAKNKQLYERAKKAEADAKAGSSVTHSTADIVALSKVHEDDVERVERYARSEGLSIREAMKNPELKAILDLREEQRNTASSANVTNVRRGPTKVSDDVLLAKASKGDLPDSDEELERLIKAKAKQK